MVGMIGILNAQMNLNLASQTQRIANSTVSAGRIRERQGVTDENVDAIKEGQELQAKGEEIRGRVFEYLGKAMNDINNAAKECEETAKDCEETEDSDENYLKSPFSNLLHEPGEFYVAIGDTVRGSINKSVSAPSQSKVNIAV